VTHRAADQMRELEKLLLGNRPTPFTIGK